MRILIRSILIFCIIFVSYTLFFHYGKYTPNEQLKEENVQISNEETTNSEKQVAEGETVPNEGLLSFMEKSSEEITAILGEPDRIDPSAYDYDWWIYEQEDNQYIQVGVLNQRVVSVYGIGKGLNAKPFVIGQPIQEVFKIQPVSSSLSLEYEGNSYRFEFSEEDMNTRPTVKMGDVFVQLYIDKFDGILSSIRVIDAETFIKQRSYEVTYRGELIEPKEISEDKWEKIEAGAEQQILSITNMLRARHGLAAVQWHEDTSRVAFLHSKDMKENEYFSHESPTEGTLVNRLAQLDIKYQMAGENIAAQYVDAIAASEGWLNSKGHRDTMLNEEFTHLGVGVDGLYYTQNFITTWDLNQ
ncbi:CAP domain-containing protein [Metabacillus endolithicus]|uniref:CAP domain-containing protein n=1 Tax=Metabacillus endolithicus TaxID=1535204 RepID=A0ABW5BWB4_9BACI|nr:CAP domain-containing protein [Metabacillus endolithicus]UPG65981.1 CAP domain-containing protein [Metabacillus endolithicus]